MMIVKKCCGFLFLLFMSAVGSSTQSADAGIIYQNDFEGGVGSEWSKTTTSLSPNGARRFLGEFGSEGLQLTLNPVTPGKLTVAFELYVIGSWDGSPPGSGPDIFDLNVADGLTLLHTTFCNVDTNQLPSYVQNYPNDHPGSTNPSQTGASQIDSLGYNTTGSDWGDSVYDLSFEFLQSATSLQLNFSSSLVTPQPGSGNEERWGIDNIVVSLVPEPTTSALALAALCLAMSRRRAWP